MVGPYLPAQRSGYLFGYFSTLERTQVWSDGQEAIGHAPTRRQGAGRDPGVGSLSPFADSAGWTCLRRSSTSTKELPSFQVIRLAGTYRAHTLSVPRRRTSGTQAQKTLVNVLAANFEIDLLVLPRPRDRVRSGFGRVVVDALGVPRTSTVSDGKRVRSRPRGRLGQKT
jgi:hypothetical protein